MKNRILFFALLTLFIVVSGCKTDELLKVTKLQTGDITDINYNSAKAIGTFIDLSGNVNDYGHCWNLAGTPTINDSKYTISGIAQKGNYTSNLTALAANTKYYVRAYAIDGGQVIYGNEAEFTTSEMPNIYISSPSSSSHWVGGEINSIKWTDNIDDKLIIELYKNYGMNLVMQIAEVENVDINGNFNWTVPDLEYRDDYRIKIKGKTNASINHTSSPFIISETSGSTSNVSDFELNSYATIKIGKQWWMAQNLRATKYANGADIPLITDNTGWGNLENNNSDKAYCWYNNNESNKNVYGALYTWAAAMDGNSSSSANPSGIQGVCPAGWHLPSEYEWKELELFLGMEYEAVYNLLGYRGTDQGGKLKSTDNYWSPDNVGATNSTGFTAQPGGFRYPSSMGFNGIGYTAIFWTSTQSSSTDVNYRELQNSSPQIIRNFMYKSEGHSVRCIRD